MKICTTAWARRAHAWRHTMAKALRAGASLLGGALLAAPLAHAGFANGDFETGNFSGWTVTDYRNNGIATFPPTQKSDLNLQPPVTAPVSAVVSAPPGTAPAPDAPGGVLPIPFKGSYSARINARGNNNRAAGIYQEATMALGDVDPTDGKIHLRMAVAPVIQDGGHDYEQQAYFYVEVRNKTKNTSLFYTFNFAAQPGIPWQTVGGYQYTGWQAIDVAPGSGLLDVGDVVTVEIIAAGCSQGGHSGEIYVDSIAPFFAGLSIAATGPTSSKPGDNVAYTYNYGNSSGVMVFNGKVVVKAPQSVKTGGAATQPTPADYLNATFVSASGASCVEAPTGTVTCDVGDLVDHASGSFNIVWNVPSNSSTVSPTNKLNHGDYAISANGASTVRGPLVQTTLLGAASSLTDLAVTVTDGVSAVAPGGSLTYTVTVTNNGPLAVTGAPLVQTVANGLTVGAWSCAAVGSGSCSAASGSGQVNPGDLTVSIPAGESITLTVTATAAASGNASTTFHVDPPAGITDSNTANNTAGDTDNIGTLHTLAVTKSGSGTGSVVSSTRDLVCDNSASPVCSVSVADGYSKILTAAASAGSIFKGWSTGPCAGSATNPCAVPAMTGNVTADAEFAKAYIVTPNLSGGNGTLGPNTPQQVEENGSTVFTFTPNAGYVPKIDSSTCPGTLAGNTYTVTPVSANCTFTASFTNDTVTLTSSAGAGGSIGPSGATLIARGNSQTYTVTPNSGFTPIMGGTCQGTLNTSVTPNTYTVSNVQSSCTVIATFTNDPVHVTSSVNGGNGSIDTVGQITLPRGGARVYTFSPAAGYAPVVTGNCPGTLVGSTYTVSPVNADCDFAVAFTNQTVNITATVTGGTGTINNPGVTAIAHGGGMSYTATPGAGNVAVFGGTCSATRAGDTVTVTNALTNCSVDVKFVATADAVTVTTVVAGTRGTITTPGQNASGQTVLGRGDSRVYTLAPAPGYKPVLVPGTNACTGILSNNTFTVNNVQNDCFVRIRFVPKDALTSVPTLSEWGLIILSVAMGLFALGVRRQQMR